MRSPKTVLITGASGFLGKALTLHLKKTWPKARLYGVGRRSYSASIPFYRCDLRQRKPTEALLRRLNPEIIFHCAGTTAPSSERTFLESHVKTTQTLLESIERSQLPVSRVVVIGSAAEYGNVPLNRQPIRELEECHPLSAYGKSKWRATQMAQASIERNVPVIIVRLFNILDTGLPAHFATSHFLTLLSKEAKKITTGPLSDRRDFLSLPDVCRGLAAVAIKGQVGDIYNLCSGKTVSMKQVLKELMSAVNTKISVVQKRKGSPRTSVRLCVGSPAKIIRDTGWTPKESWQHTLHRMVQSVS